MSEMNRVRELIKEYEDLPEGVWMMASMIMKNDVKACEKAIQAGDIVAQLVAYENLKKCTW